MKVVDIQERRSKIDEDARADIIEALEGALSIAREGGVTGIAIAMAKDSGETMTNFVYHSHGTVLLGTVSRLEQRVCQAILDQD